MNALTEIGEWSKALGDWLSDAARRAVESGTLSAADIEDVIALLKSSRGLPDDKKRTAHRLDPSSLPKEPPHSSAVALRAIRAPTNVNALNYPDGIEFEPNGLTIVFGPNGAGKSGYARILKKVCRARDQELILPNLFVSAPSTTAPATAKMEWQVGPNTHAVEWTDGGAPAEALSAISVFDSRCARLFVDDEYEVSVAPYGVDVLRELVRVCSAVRAELEKEIGETVVDLAAFDHLMGDTSTGAFVRSLSHKSDKSVATKLATLSTAEAARLEMLKKRLEADPSKQLVTLRRLAQRVEALVREISEVTTELSNDSVEALRKALAEYVAASAASEIAATSLLEGGVALKGTGSDPWKELLVSALAFAKAGPYPSQTYPPSSADAKCVLCQQILDGDASARLKRFATFLEADTQKRADELRRVAGALFKALEAVPLKGLPTDKALIEEIDEMVPGVADSLNELLHGLEERRAAVVEMAKGKAILEIAPLPDGPLKAIADLQKKLAADEAELQKILNGGEWSKQAKELAELTARQQLNATLPAIESAIERLQRIATLQECVRETGTTGITRKATELTQTAVAKGLNAALDTELKRLGVTGIGMAMDMRGERGKGRQQLTLNLARQVRGAKVSSILSEGEQRAIAIACFLAEVTVADNKSGIAFDDPVSSLDNSRRERIAMRLAQEACVRQVIVFTHDLSFAWALVEAGERCHAKVRKQRVFASGQSKGIAHESLPFEGGKLAARINELLDMAQKTSKAFESTKDLETYEQQVRTCYGRMRDCWERLVEEALFGDTVRRFRNSVTTKNLKRAYVDDADFVDVWDGMTRCSAFAHDSPTEAPPECPQPQEVVADIQKLRDVYERIKARAKDVEKARVKLVPQAS